MPMQRIELGDKMYVKILWSNLLDNTCASTQHHVETIALANMILEFFSKTLDIQEDPH